MNASIEAQSAFRGTMAITKFSDRDDVKKLILQIERDLLGESRFKAMLIDAGATLRAHRKELRVAKARLSRRSRRDAAGKRRER